MVTRVVDGVVRTIADVRGVDPVELDSRVEDWIDSDALRQLAAHGSDSWTLTFEFRDHHVTVAGDGWILLDGDRVRRWKSEDEEGGILVQ